MFINTFKMLTRNVNQYIQNVDEKMFINTFNMLTRNVYQYSQNVDEKYFSTRLK